MKRDIAYNNQEIISSPYVVMAGLNQTPASSPEKKESTGRKTPGATTTALACLALACSILESPRSDAQTVATYSVPSSPSASASAEKGGGQVVDIGGRKMSFIEIAGLPDAEKEDILKRLKPSQQARFNDFELQVANQRIEIKQSVEQVAKQRIEIKKNALDQSLQLGKILEEVFADQGIKTSSPETIKKNKERGQIILSALSNPLVGGEISPASQKVLKLIGESLISGNNIAFASQKITNVMKEELAKIQ